MARPTTSSKTGSKTKDTKRAFPFAYYGEGSARPIREKDGLLALVVLAEPASAAELRAIAATAPLPMRTLVKNGKRWLSLETSDILAADVRSWAKKSGAAIAKGDGAAYTHLAGALETWIRGVHAAHPVSLFFVGSDGKYGPWHADTVARFGERVRPVLDLLRAEPSGKAHAEWITVSFLHSGATTSYADIRTLAEEDPPGYAGDLGQRYALARPLVDALGPASLSALGPYGELGFWARARGRELAPDPVAHAAHLVKLADACAKKRQPAVKLLLVAAASCLLRDHAKDGGAALSAAITIAKRAAGGAPLWIGFLETVVDAARGHGGAAAAVAVAKLFARDSLALASTTDDRDDGLRVANLRKLLAQDLTKAPDAALEAALATPRAVTSPRGGPGRAGR